MMDINKYLSFMDEQVVQVTNAVSHQFLHNMWYNIIDGNPVVSGLSRYSWRLTQSSPSTSRPQLMQNYQYNDGRVYGEPPKPQVLRTGTLYKNYFMVNNQDYVTDLNEDTSRYYFGFIDDGIRRAVLQTDISNTNVTGVRLA